MLFICHYLILVILSKINIERQKLKMEIINLFEQVLVFRIFILFILGLCIGSFLNVVIYRLPLMLDIVWRKQSQEFLEIIDNNEVNKISLSFPASHCPMCKASIPWWSNIPLLGYLILGAKCYKCKTNISLRYPLVELVTGILFGCIGYLYSDILSVSLLLIFIAVIMALIFIDLDTFLLPDELTLPLIWIGLLVNIDGLFSGDLKNAVIGAVIGYMSLWSLYWGFKLITGKEGMGYGDFKLLAAIGAWLGWVDLLSVLMFASLSGLVYALILRCVGRLNKGNPIPFGPFLGSGAIITLFFGKQFIELLLRY